MPYHSNKEVPARFKHGRSANQVRAFRHAFQSARGQGHDESSQYAIAQAAANRASKKGKKEKDTKKSLSFRSYYHQLWIDAGLMDENGNVIKKE